MENYFRWQWKIERAFSFISFLFVNTETESKPFKQYITGDSSVSIFTFPAHTINWCDAIGTRF